MCAILLLMWCIVCSHADANNQWRLGDALVEDPRATPFFEAMQLAKGTVSVLDSGGIVFKRVWCAQPCIVPAYYLTSNVS